MKSETQKIQQANKRKSPQFFVMRRSLWQDDQWKASAGPFATRYEAQREADNLADNGMRHGRQDLKSVVETCVLSKTNALKYHFNDLHLVIMSIMYFEETQSMKNAPAFPEPLPAEWFHFEGK